MWCHFGGCIGPVCFGLGRHNRTLVKIDVIIIKYELHSKNKHEIRVEKLNIIGLYLL
jgi:hypothetical protein